jgi:fatty-acyl-CoA synthase
MSFESAEASVAWMLGAGALPSHIQPDRLALAWESHTRTYAELRTRALALARSLREMGAHPGDRVGAHLLNRGETFELYFACAYAGLTFTPLNWRMAARELEMVMADCTPRLVFSEPAVADSIRAPAERLGVQLVMLEHDASGDAYERLAAGPPIEPPFQRTDPHLILYTSGTTGRPKGVMLSHSNIYWYGFQQAIRFPAMDSSMVTLVISPTFNTAGINEISLPAFLVGGTVAILPSRGWTAEKMSDYIDRHQATHTNIYPSMMEPFLEADARREIGLRSLKFVLTGGENVPPAMLSRFRERWRHFVTIVGFGGTENGSPTTNEGVDIDNHPGSVGRVTLGSALRIQDKHGNALGPGEIGEIWVAGGAVISGYWNAPELTSSVLRDGWIDTGDLGFLDEDGYLYLSGRSRDLIISKGQNIYPAEIENALLQHDALLDGSVVGVPDPEFGEVVCAVIVVKPDRTLDANAVIEFVRERLASYKAPRHVLFVDELPRNPGNKVLKRELAELARKELALDGMNHH